MYLILLGWQEGNVIAQTRRVHHHQVRTGRELFDPPDPIRRLRMAMELDLDFATPTRQITRGPALQPLHQVSRPALGLQLRDIRARFFLRRFAVHVILVIFPGKLPQHKGMRRGVFRRRVAGDAAPRWQGVKLLDLPLVAKRIRPPSRHVVHAFPFHLV